MYFNNASDVAQYYGDGPIVDAAHMLFSQQVSPVFTGSVNRVYCYKTNQSTQASRSVVQGSLQYGTISAMAQGTSGNLISTQILTGNPIAYPSTTFHWLMNTSSVVTQISASGVLLGTRTSGTGSRPQDIVSSLATIAGITATGGTFYEVIGPDQIDTSSKTATNRTGTATNSGTSWSARLGFTVSGSNLSQITLSAYTSVDGTTYTAGVFTGNDINNINVGDILYIPPASSLAGTGNKNSASCYLISAVSASGITATKITNQVQAVVDLPNTVVPSSSTVASGDQQLVASAEFMIYRPITITTNLAPIPGDGLSLEICTTNGGQGYVERSINYGSFVSPVSSSVALGASVSLTVTGTQGIFSIQNGSWQNVPKPGSILWVAQQNILSGANSANNGAWIVTAAGSTSITTTKASGSGISVAVTNLNSIINPFDIQAPMISTAVSGVLILPAFEPTVYVSASRQSDGLSFPTSTVGGRIVLELGYAGTSGTVNIDLNNFLSTTVTGGTGTNITKLNLGAYKTMGDLIKYLNSLTGYVARVSNNQYLSLSPFDVLDQVTGVGICSGFIGAAQTYPGRLKADAYDFRNLFDLNTGLMSFTFTKASIRVSGLPSVDPVTVFLTGGTQGSTANIDIANGFDAGLKIEASQVIPLFSRDAALDIADGMTDSASTYTIDSIVSALLSHVNTASNGDYRKERLGLSSYRESFAVTKNVSSKLSGPRINMFFQDVNAVGSDGNLSWFLPWMGSCMIAAGRTQAALGQSMCRKAFACTDVRHLGGGSIFSSSSNMDFDPDLKSDQEDAILAGLIFLRPVTGAGQRMESPDASTYVSLSNDPKEWFYSRTNVEFVADEVIKTTRSTVDNFIGQTTVDVSPAILRKAIGDVLNGFVSAGALKNYQIQALTSLGNGYVVKIRILPVEAVEFIELDFVAGRDAGQ
jgi:hypothetical protein